MWRKRYHYDRFGILQLPALIAPRNAHPRKRSPRAVWHGKCVTTNAGLKKSTSGVLMAGHRRANTARLRIVEEPDLPVESAESVGRDGPRPFPVASRRPNFPAMIPDEILDYYGWVFCQGGFLNLQMTFEQFLAVVAAINPLALCPECEANEN
jgi:hypothetical protein